MCVSQQEQERLTVLILGHYAAPNMEKNDLHILFKKFKGLLWLCLLCVCVCDAQ